MTYTDITYEIVDGVATITLDRPERLNALSPGMADQISAALDAAVFGPVAARVLLLKGAGRAFCSGADLQVGPGVTPPDGCASYEGLTQHYNPLMVKISRLPMPVICAMHGPAAGLGASLALAADFVIAANSAYFVCSWVNVGLIPDCGMSWALGRLAGKARATEMMMLGERVEARKAARWGLIYKAVKDDALDVESAALAGRLASGPTFAFGVLRQNLARSLETGFGAALQAEAEGQRRMRDSADFREGVAAFAEKRRPGFKGA